MASNKSVVGIVDEVPNTIEYEGVKWLVMNRTITGELVGKGKDAMGNPKADFKAFDHITPAEYNKLASSLEEEHDMVELQWGWDITSLFREVINKDGVSKSVSTRRVQRKYKDGKWDVVNPIDIENELAPTEQNTASSSLMNKIKKGVKGPKAMIYAVYGVVGATLIAGLILLSKIFR